MLKNLFYALLFIGLVVGLAFLMSTYSPIQQGTYDPSAIAELSKLQVQVAELAQLTAQVAELTRIAEQVPALYLELEALKQVSTPSIDPAVTHESPNYLLSRALLQTLNCKYVAQNHSSARLIAELVVLEETVQELSMDQDTVLREIALARAETAAQIPSAQDRLEIIWRLLMHPY